MISRDTYQLPSAGVAGTKEQGLDQRSETFFSTLDFVEAWSRSLGPEYSILALPVSGSGPPRTMYAVQTGGSYWRRSVFLGPYGLYASPGWRNKLEQSTLKALLSRLSRLRTESFVWNVRFDHEQLAAGLSDLGLGSQESYTHVLRLSCDYESVFAGYNAMIRNHVRRARRSGLIVRQASSPECVAAYYRLHGQLAEQKGNYRFVYPLELFLQMVKIQHATRLLVAEYEGRIIAGGLFFRDGESVLYWHGASDREFSRYYPSCAVLDEAVQWACESGAAFFNFGGSAGLESLEQFKSFWGARRESNWVFEWTSPFWSFLSTLKGKLLPSRIDQ